jgi:hypothetical protein
MMLYVLSSIAHWKVYMVYVTVSTLGNYSPFIEELDSQPVTKNEKGKARTMQFSKGIRPLLPSQVPAPAAIDSAHLDTASISSPS